MSDYHDDQAAWAEYRKTLPPPGKPNQHMAYWEELGVRDRAAETFRRVLQPVQDEHSVRKFRGLLELYPARPDETEEAYAVRLDGIAGWAARRYFSELAGK